MSQYFALIHKDPDSAYGVSFPDLPGCFSAADDAAELSRNAAEALALFLEDGAAPAPRGLDALRADPAVAVELAAGAALMLVAPPPRRAARPRKASDDAHPDVRRRRSAPVPV